ncbi:hypothetical protein DPEC_G00111780 [Dallia pectoralis]|uniref:Uncharacterized protein n=1 Tax=Dallia pectoralis TaxID=75939 RepID=A0ACC2GTJ9_DALPE|nr:hypothetical protein DPEC_G00111780 [Dallia pectoralis]
MQQYPAVSPLHAQLKMLQWTSTAKVISKVEKGVPAELCDILTPPNTRLSPPHTPSFATFPRLGLWGYCYFE